MRSIALSPQIIRPIGSADVCVGSNGRRAPRPGALELAAALLALTEGILPPTAHLEQPDPACGVRHVARQAERGAPPRAVMSNSFGFGGSNVVLIAERA